MWAVPQKGQRIAALDVACRHSPAAISCIKLTLSLQLSRDRLINLLNATSESLHSQILFSFPVLLSSDVGTRQNTALLIYTKESLLQSLLTINNNMKHLLFKIVPGTCMNVQIGNIRSIQFAGCVQRILRNNLLQYLEIFDQSISRNCEIEIMFERVWLCKRQTKYVQDPKNDGVRN